jgi:nucleoside phosphorylase
VKAQQRQLVGIDMELYGVYCAATQAGDPVPTFFGVKSVCDFADEEKADMDQAYAAYTSAKALEKFVAEYFGR